MSLYRSFLSVGALTLISRLAGFVRDMLMAVVLGTGPAADAFFAAFRFPNLFRRLFAEGAFNTAFVPLFARRLEADGPDAARLLAARIMSWLLAALVAVTIVAEIFMEQLLLPFVPGFAGEPEKYALTVLLTRVLFPYLACMSLMAAYAAILNSLSRYFAAALAPVVLNVVTVAALVPLMTLAVEAREAALWVAGATMLAGVVQLVVVWSAVRRAGMLTKLVWPSFDAETRRFWVLAVPAVISGGITQINIFIGTIIASGAAGAISYLYYADRLYQLPLGIIGIAIGTVLLPELSRHLKAERDGEAREVQAQSLLVAMLLSVPAATALIAMAEPIVRVLFERGAFDAAATTETAGAVVAFAAGLPAFVLIRVLQPGFFAREDTVTPTLFAAVSVVINVVLSLLLFANFAHVGIAVATSVSAWANAALLAVWLMRRGHFRLDTAEWVRHAKILVVAVAMAAALLGVLALMPGVFEAGANALAQIVVLAGLCALGLLGYFAAIHFSGVQRMGALVRRLRR